LCGALGGPGVGAWRETVMGKNTKKSKRRKQRKSGWGVGSLPGKRGNLSGESY